MKNNVLYVAATPIGNLEDMTFRSVRILKNEVSAIFCEDTRQTRKLLDHYEINAQTYSLHAHSADHAVARAIEFLSRGESIAYVTDCGTPCVSDPGSRLVAAAREAGFTVCPLPGASALTAISSVSGFPGKHIYFAGFLSKKEGRRQNELSALKAVKGILVIYESPHRIHKTISSIAAVFKDKPILIGREMTKMFEEFVLSTAEELSAKPELIKEKGEFAIAIDNSDPDEDEDE